MGLYEHGGSNITGQEVKNLYPGVETDGPHREDRWTEKLDGINLTISVSQRFEETLTPLGNTQNGGNLPYSVDPTKVLDEDSSEIMHDGRSLFPNGEPEWWIEMREARRQREELGE